MKTVVGKARSTKAIRAAGHAAGFDKALENALGQLSRQWGAGSYDNVRVEYRADISVTNPGSVDTYRVYLG
jgi:hypothetical protein